MDLGIGGVLGLEVGCIWSGYRGKGGGAVEGLGMEDVGSCDGEVVG